MFCLQCGSKVPDDSKFCVECGAPVQAPVRPAVQAQPQMPAQQAPAQPAVQTSAPAQPQPQEPVRCPECGMLAFLGRKHCLICGADMTGAAILNSDDAPEKKAKEDSAD